MVAQSVIRCDQDKKKDLLLHLFSQHGWHQTLIFCRTKHGADALAKKLEQSGVKTAALHGNKTQGARTRALADFKSGRLAALVATDIAARGIDIDSLPRVVNFELPHVPEDYIHRIGRTGRAGSSGEALSFVSLDEGRDAGSALRTFTKRFWEAGCWQARHHKSCWAQLWPTCRTFTAIRWWQAGRIKQLRGATTALISV
jgi:superfamily II DNA/RNA helicase